MAPRQIRTFQLALICFFMFLLFFNCSYSAKDTLEQGSVLPFTTRLISANGTFSLGFFVRKGVGRYLGLWYTNDPNIGKVWIANRNAPIPESSIPCGLALDDEMKLQIFCSNANPLVLYSNSQRTSSSSTNVTAKLILHDDGNVLLKELNSDGFATRVLWQSFDHPSDTLLPGMKLGINEKTKHESALTSWLSYPNPAEGAFRLEWEPNELQLVIKLRGVVHWASGPFDKSSNEFEFIKSNNSRYTYTFTHVSTAEENYISYAVKGDSPLSSWSLDEYGVLWDNEVELANSHKCYGFNAENGCKRWKVPECRVHDEDFTLDFGEFIGQAPRGGQEIKNASYGDCRDACWRDCNCIAFLQNIDVGTPCQFWYIGQTYTRMDSDSATYVYNIQLSKALRNDYLETPPSDNIAHVNNLGHPKTKGVKRLAWMCTPIAVAVLTISIGLACYLKTRSTKEKENHSKKVDDKHFLELTTSDRYSQSGELGNAVKGSDLKAYEFETVMSATNNFSLARKLGEGGFGPVYKGLMSDGKEVAIKRLSTSSIQGIREFQNELVLIAGLQHTNFVRLLGYCIHHNEKMLIYEYMPNGSLDRFLFDASRRQQLSWMKRYHIIEGIAHGLLYLHKYSRIRVIHRDLKAGNVLLDENMNPKISDFGMARIFSEEELESNTMKIVGTYGYMSPEYAMEGIFSVKSDVFSFGVIVLEIISGKRNNTLYDNVHCSTNLVGYAWELWKTGAAVELMDPVLRDSYVREQLIRCIHVALLCGEEKVADRPHMAEVISTIASERHLPQPKKPYFIASASSKEDSLMTEIHGYP